MVGLQLMTASDQVSKTGLMCGLLKLAIRRPTVPHEDAGKARAEQRGRLIEAAARLNRVHGFGRGGSDPQPLQLDPDAPPGFVRRDHRPLPDCLPQGVVGGSCLAGCAMQRVHEAPGRHGEPKVLLIEPRDLAKRQSTLLVQVCAGGDGLGPQLRRRGAERV